MEHFWDLLVICVRLEIIEFLHYATKLKTSSPSGTKSFNFFFKSLSRNWINVNGLQLIRIELPLKLIFVITESVSDIWEMCELEQTLRDCARRFFNSSSFGWFSEFYKIIKSNNADNKLRHWNAYGYFGRFCVLANGNWALFISLFSLCCRFADLPESLVLWICLDSLARLSNHFWFWDGFQTLKFVLKEINLLVTVSHVAINSSLKSRHCSHFYVHKPSIIKIKIFCTKMSTNEKFSRDVKSSLRKLFLKKRSWSMIELLCVQCFALKRFTDDSFPTGLLLVWFFVIAVLVQSSLFLVTLWKFMYLTTDFDSTLSKKYLLSKQRTIKLLQSDCTTQCVRQRQVNSWKIVLSIFLYCAKPVSV